MSTSTRRSAVARELLTESGSVFVQIGDENVHLVRALLDEVFGAENFVNLITFRKTTGAGSPSGGTTVLPSVSDYLVWYARDRELVKYRTLFRTKELGRSGVSGYTQVEEPNGTRRSATPDELREGATTGRFLGPAT
jgi:adenine-specific DNA-methyltransferase